MKKVKKRSWSEWRNNVEYLCSKNSPFGKKGRAIGRRSPKFPKENVLQHHVRLWFNISDKSPVNFDAPRTSAIDLAAAKREPSEPEIYPGSPKRLPEVGKLDRIVCCSGGPPFVLRSFKWKDIRKWCERTLDHFRDEGKALTVSALCSLAMNLELDFWVCRRVAARIKAIYAEDHTREFMYLDAMVERSIRSESSERASKSKVIASAPETKGDDSPPQFRKGKGRDKWGFKLGTRTAKINACFTDVPKTVKRIEKEVGCNGASSHVSKLLAMKVIVKTPDGYVLATKEKQCRPQKASRSEKSAGKTSTRRQKGSRSAKTVKPSRRDSSTGR